MANDLLAAETKNGDGYGETFVYIQGSQGGMVYKNDLPLHEGIRHQIKIGITNLVNADGSPADLPTSAWDWEDEA